MKTPKFKIGDTTVLKRRWFLLFEDYVLCEIVFGRFDKKNSEWRYTLKIGNQFKRFCLWESELINY